MHRVLNLSIASLVVSGALWGCATVHQHVTATAVPAAPAPVPAAATPAPAPAAKPAPAPAAAATKSPAATTKQTAAAPAETPRMHINAAGLSIIKEAEGHKLKPYRDGGQWYVGYGHKANGPGPEISEEEAERLLRQDLAVCEAKVGEAAKPSLTSNEFSAMVSLCFNIGWGNFVKSSVIAKLNQGDRPGAADAFLLFTKATIGGVRQELPRLRARRERERALFLKPDAPTGA